MVCNGRIARESRDTALVLCGQQMARHAAEIIRIDEEKCNGCGACACACHEGAIAMVDGKARLMREDCLPACPTGAISFEVRGAPAYDAANTAAPVQKPPFSAA